MGDQERDVDVSRRDLGALLGALGGAVGIAALSACASRADSPSEPSPETIGKAATALSGGNVTQVDSISSLRLIVPTVADACAIVEHWHDAGQLPPYTTDGGGGIFWWTSDTSTADDGGTIIAKNTGRTGCWKRLYSGPVNVRWFGATGNGTIDDSGAIAAAITAAVTATPQSPSVYLPPGTYAVSSSIEIGYSNLTLAGSRGTTISMSGAVASKGPVLQASSQVARLTLKSLTVSDTGGACTNAVVLIGNNAVVTDFLMEDVVVLGYWSNHSSPLAGGVATDGVTIGGGSGGPGGTITTGQIRNVLVQGTTKTGFYLAGGSGRVTLTSCEASLVEQPSGANAPGFSIAGQQIQLIGCRAHDNSGAGVLVTGYPTPSTAVGTDVLIDGGQFTGNGTVVSGAGSDGPGAGIYVVTFNSLVPATRIRIAGADCFGNSGAGIAVAGATAVDIIDVSCKGNGLCGINIYGNNTTLGCKNIQIKNATICNNQIKNASGGAEARAGILLGGAQYAGDFITIDSVRLYDDQATATQILGIAVNCSSSGPSSLRITDVDAGGTTGLPVANTYFWIVPTSGATGYVRALGSGSPANVLVAPQGSMYTDTAGSAGSMLWLKTAGTDATGWTHIA
jgi:hypothetical protein